MAVLTTPYAAEVAATLVTEQLGSGTKSTLSRYSAKPKAQGVFPKRAQNSPNISYQDALSGQQAVELELEPFKFGVTSVNDIESLAAEKVTGQELLQIFLGNSAVDRRETVASTASTSVEPELAQKYSLIENYFDIYIKNSGAVPTGNSSGAAQFSGSAKSGQEGSLDGLMLDAMSQEVLLELLSIVVAPDINNDGEVTFSLIGMGEFFIEASSTDGGVRLAEKQSGISVSRGGSMVQIPVGIGVPGDKKNTDAVPLTLEEFLLSIVSDLWGMPLVYGLLVMLGLLTLFSISRFVYRKKRRKKKSHDNTRSGKRSPRIYRRAARI